MSNIAECNKMLLEFFEVLSACHQTRVDVLEKRLKAHPTLTIAEYEEGQIFNIAAKKGDIGIFSLLLKHYMPTGNTAPRDLNHFKKIVNKIYLDNKTDSHIKDEIRKCSWATYTPEELLQQIEERVEKSEPIQGLLEQNKTLTIASYNNGKIFDLAVKNDDGTNFSYLTNHYDYEQNSQILGTKTKSDILKFIEIMRKINDDSPPSHIQEIMLDKQPHELYKDMEYSLRLEISRPEITHWASNVEGGTDGMPEILEYTSSYEDTTSEYERTIQQTEHSNIEPSAGEPNLLRSSLTVEIESVGALDEPRDDPDL